MKNIIKSFKFQPKNHKKLQNLWQAAHYEEKYQDKGKDLGAVERFRIRKKHPLPQSIWDGEETNYTFKVKKLVKIKI